ncbi:MAG TPA: restriction endonuclease subunit S [Clostridia bacterium]|nr:restriction endonuclease subunit S [Clostridia bacterium]
MKNLVPKRRFKGFAGSWEKRKLGSIAGKIYGGGTPRTTIDKFWNGDIPWIQSSDLTDGKVFDITPNKMITMPGLNNSATKLVPGNSIAVITRVGVGKLALMPFPYTTSQDFVSLSRLNINPWFGVYSCYKKLQGESYAVQGTSIKGITKDELLEKSISIPSINEQEQLGNFFKQLDNLITLHQHKLDKLGDIKSAYLYEMFPQEGELYPKRRFAGFTEPWEKRRLGELGEIQSGIGFPEAEQGGTGGVPFFKISDMNNLGNEHKMVTSNNYVNDEQLQRRKWKPIESIPAVIFAKVGAAIMLNRKRLVCTPFLIDNNTMAYSFGEAWDTNFGKVLFETINLPQYAQVGALPSYNGLDIKNIEVTLPRKDEQEYIGGFFENLDNLITLQQRKLEKLEALKEAFLNEMFV